MPPTCGFFSKFYLIRGGIEAGRWEFVIALLFSSLVNVILFFRIIENAFFHIKPEEGEADDEEATTKPAAATPADPGGRPVDRRQRALLLIGLFNQPIVGWIQATLRPLAIVGGQG